MVVSHTVVFVCFSLMSNDVEHLLIVHKEAITLTSLVKCLYRYFQNFGFLYQFVSSLYILDASSCVKYMHCGYLFVRVFSFSFHFPFEGQVLVLRMSDLPISP